VTVSGGAAVNAQVGENTLAAANSATLSQAWAEGTLPGGAGTKSAKEHALDAAASAAGVATDANRAEAAEAASALNKTGAETAQTGAQAAATTADADAAAAAAALAATIIARDLVLGWSYSLNTAQLEDFLQGDGSIQMGVGAFVPTGSGGLGTAIGTGAGAGMGVDGQKASLVGGGAGENAKGYAPAYVGVYAGKNAWGEYAAGIGTHVFQGFNRSGVEVRGFGTPASGTLTFTGVGTATKGFELGGVLFTGVAGSPAANQYQIGATAAETAKNAHRAVTDARAANVALQDVIVRRAGAALTVVSLAFGTIGNAFTLATDDAAIALSGATLSGGAAAVNSVGVTGPIAMGFGAGQDAQPVKQRAGWNEVILSGLPVAGDQFVVGAVPVTFTWVTGAPVGANEAGIYGDLATTMFELAERLATHASTSVDDAWYYPLPSGVRAVSRTNGGALHRFDFRRTTNATTTNGRFLRGGSSDVGRDISLLGFSTGSGSICSRATVNGSSSGVGSTLVRSSVLGSSSGSYGYLENTYLVGQDNGLNSNLFGCFAFGNNNFVGSTSTPYIALTGITPTGILTLATPHGFMPGRTYQMEQRNAVDANDRIKRSAAGVGAPTNINTGANAFQCVVLGPRTLQIYQFKNDDAAFDTFSVSGTVGNIEVRSISNTWTNACVIGNTVVAENNAVTVCGPDEPRFVSKASEANVFNAPLLPNSYIFTTAHRMQCAFSTNPANGEQVTVFGHVLTLRTTAVALTDVQIGANATETVRNIIRTIRDLTPNPTYHAAFSRILAYQTLNTNPAGAFAIVLCDTGTDMTLSTNSAVGTVTTPAALAVGNVPAASSFPADLDGVIFRTTNNPRRGGQPGLARLNRTAGRVEFLP
jgi:hypothetical protein